MGTKGDKHLISKFLPIALSHIWSRETKSLSNVHAQLALYDLWVVGVEHMVNNTRHSAFGHFPHSQSIDTHPRSRIAIFSQYELHMCKIQRVDRRSEDRAVQMIL